MTKLNSARNSSIRDIYTASLTRTTMTLTVQLSVTAKRRFFNTTSHIRLTHFQFEYISNWSQVASDLTSTFVTKAK